MFARHTTIAALTVLCLAAVPAAAQTQAPAAPQDQAVAPEMTLSRLAEIIFALDENAISRGNAFEMTVGPVTVLIVTDPEADRMRAMVPIRSAAGLTEEDLTRMMQANFDSALDARYALANGAVWAVFIHPLSPLTKEQFVSGLGQTVNAAATFGTLYTGGQMQFGGGDSVPLQRQLIDDLLKKAEEI